RSPTLARLHAGGTEASLWASMARHALRRSPSPRPRRGAPLRFGPVRAHLPDRVAARVPAHLRLGRRADESARPLRLYAALELAIAGFSAVSPPLLDGARAVYLRLGGTVRLG